MRTTQLKNILIERIQSIEDVSFLKALKVLTDKKNEKQVYKLSADEKNKIKEARKQIENDEIYTNKEVFEKVETWLKEV